MAERRTPDETPAERKRRETEKLHGQINRLRAYPEFAVLQRLLEGAIVAQQALLRKLIVTPQDQADHNHALGLLKGLAYALRGTEILQETTK
jgi:hypothetical protein